jgi:hypothetical protein
MLDNLKNACLQKTADCGEKYGLGNSQVDFVMHSLRHTILTRYGESGVDVFTIMRIAGQTASWFRSGMSIQP